MLSITIMKINGCIGLKEVQTRILYVLGWLDGKYWDWICGSLIRSI